MTPKVGTPHRVFLLLTKVIFLLNYLWVLNKKKNKKNACVFAKLIEPLFSMH